MSSSQDCKARIDVAMAKEKADLVIQNAKVVCTFTEEILETSVALYNGKVVALGYEGQAKKVVDAKGAYLAPSFIDAHIHIESSLLNPEGFAEAVAPHGTGAVVSDPHEIVNVLGLRGFQYMVENARNLPLDILYTIPSCVPATHMETSGADFGEREIREAKRIYPNSPALSEMMNYPGVCFGAPDVLAKIEAAHSMGLMIDGHSPMLRGKMLQAYLNAEITTDHECSTIEEAQEKLRLGMFLLIREGSAAKNLKALLSILKDSTVHRICLASDDRHPDDLLTKGHMDYTLRLLLENGVSLPRAVRLMTLNPALLYRLQNRGGIAPGYEANLVLFDSHAQIQSVYYQGVEIANQGQLLQPIVRKKAKLPASVSITPHLGKILEGFPREGQVRTIGVIPGEILTESLVCDVEEINKGDLAYLAVVERHGKNQNVGLGFVKGMGIQKGVIASTVAHDSHNLILLGKSLPDMLVAAQQIAEMQGGFVAVLEKQTLASVALPLGGLMSPKSASEMALGLSDLDKAAHTLGISISAPFMLLSFLALPVIPHLKLTDKGLVDVDRFEIVSVGL